MNVNEIKQKKAKLNTDIALAIGSLTEKFYNETSLWPEAIYVDMTPVYSMGKSSPVMTVTNVDVRLSL